MIYWVSETFCSLWNADLLDQFIRSKLCHQFARISSAIGSGYTLDTFHRSFTFNSDFKGDLYGSKKDCGWINEESKVQWESEADQGYRNASTTYFSVIFLRTVSLNFIVEALNSFSLAI